MHIKSFEHTLKYLAQKRESLHVDKLYLQMFLACSLLDIPNLQQYKNYDLLGRLQIALLP